MPDKSPHTLEVVTARDTYTRPLNSIDEVAQIIQALRYGDRGGFVIVGDAPITIVKRDDVQSVTLHGLSLADVARHEQEQREAQRKLHEKLMGENPGTGLVGNALQNYQTAII